MIPPRLATPRRPERVSRGARVDHYMKLLGHEPHAWQALMGSVFMEEDPATGLLWYRQVGAEISRQSGKTAWIAARVCQQCLDYPHQHVGFTSQDRNNAARAWYEHVDLILDSDLASSVKHVSRKNGNELLRFHNGSWYEPLTPNRHGSRGRSLDLAVVDEALKHRMELLSALGPTLSARPGSQLLILSNAGDDSSELLNAMRERALPVLDDPEARRAWMEWSADPEAPGFNPYDEKLWHECMPTLDEPNGLDIDFVRQMAAVMDKPDFCREYLCVPSTSISPLVIPPEIWKVLYRTDVMIGDDVCLGVDVTPGRDQAAIVAAGQVDNYTAIELIEAHDGLGWVIDRVAEVAQRWGCPVAIDQGGPAGVFIPALIAADVEVAPVTMQGYARACGYFYDSALQCKLTHLDQYQLNDAVAGATKRPLGDAWAWNRRAGVNISPLVAATLAVWTVATRVAEPVPMIH